MNISCFFPFFVFVIALFSGSINAATIYECRAYNGTNFFSNNYCSQSNGIGVLNHSVPDNMTFEQQVKVVEAVKAGAAARARENDARWTQTTTSDTNQSKQLQCQQLDQAISSKDSELRQPHTAQWGDYLTGERKKLMDQRFALRC